MTGACPVACCCCPALTPILVADMHAQIDNLLTVLSQNAFLDALEEGSAALVILGDAVHSEVDGQLREMETSMLLMDLIFRLKLRFPRRFSTFAATMIPSPRTCPRMAFRRGCCGRRNLPSDAARLSARHGGVLPAVALRRRFRRLRRLPRGSTDGRVSKEMLVNIHRHPELILELINNRLRRPNRPQGYSRGDVKHFRRALQLDKDTPVHRRPHADGSRRYPVAQRRWHRNHHVLFSAHPEQVGVFTRVDDVMVPLVYPVDALTPIINRLEVEPG
jgi:hypothetical protein